MTRVIAALACKNGLISACRSADHQGECRSSAAINKLPEKDAKSWRNEPKSVCCGPKSLWARSGIALGTPVLPGAGPQHQENQL
jgi:hypothetical protein